MKPALSDGDFVLCSSWAKKPKINKLLIVEHAQFGTIIKRVIGVNADGSFWLDSDNDVGIRSERMGLLNPQQVVGSVLYCITKI